MSHNIALDALLDRLASTDQPVLFDWYTVQQWPEGALKQLLEVGLLVKAAPAEGWKDVGFKYRESVSVGCRFRFGPEGAD